MSTPMTADDLAWTVEEACQNAWPSPRQLLLQGWLLRASGGPTRRTNSVNPLRSGPRDPTGIIAAAEAIYRALGQPCVFRVPSLAPEMEAPLERQGYLAQAETCTLFADLADHRSMDGADVELTDHPSEDWYRTWAALSGASDRVQGIYRAMTDSIALPKAFVARRVEGQLVAIAYGVLHDGLLVVESVATHPEQRQRGHARQTVQQLMDWARGQGAQGSGLQVVAENAPALALYRSLGFTRELYRYHYRCKELATLR